jgi:O-antigen ligase
VLVRARAAGGGPDATRHANWIVLALVIAAVALAAVIGLTPILDRMEPEQLRLNAEGRLAIYAATMRAAIEFLPFGSGLATFADVFPRFQTEGFGGYVDHAHNDYLQLFMELGLVAPVIVGLLLAAYVTRIAALVQHDAARSFVVLQLAAGIGLLPMILHSLFDFALHMPANAMWFATLAGVMLHPGVNSEAGKS